MNIVSVAVFMLQLQLSNCNRDCAAQKACKYLVWLCIERTCRPLTQRMPEGLFGKLLLTCAEFALKFQTRYDCLD